MYELLPLKKQNKMKIILIGDKNSGKSCFLNSLIYKSFSLVKEISIGIEIGNI
jgi:GTPase SAR1 family protein